MGTFQLFWWHLCIFPTLGHQTDACKKKKKTDESKCRKSIAFQIVIFIISMHVVALQFQVNITKTILRYPHYVICFSQTSCQQLICVYLKNSLVGSTFAQWMVGWEGDLRLMRLWDNYCEECTKGYIQGLLSSNEDLVETEQYEY